MPVVTRWRTRWRAAPRWVPSAPTQFARPASDLASGGWTTQTGATTNLYQAIDEVSVDDTDYIQGPLGTTNSTAQIGLSSLVDPSVSVGHVVRYRYWKEQQGGQPVQLEVRLVQGGTVVIAARTHTNISAIPTTADFALSAAEADSITNYADLALWFIQTVG